MGLKTRAGESQPESCCSPEGTGWVLMSTFRYVRSSFHGSFYSLAAMSPRIQLASRRMKNIEQYASCGLSMLEENEEICMEGGLTLDGDVFAWDVYRLMQMSR